MSTSSYLPKISIIVPVFNVEKYLPGCLNSLLAQTMTDFEVICVNDGSTDGCGKILDDYVQKDDRFISVHQQNKGLSGARNTGLNFAKGEYVYFLDSDDYLHPDALKTLYEIAEKENVDMVTGELIHTTELYHPIETRIDINSLKTIRFDETFYNFLNRKEIKTSVCTRLCKRSLLKNIRFIEGIYFEDVPFTTLLMEQASNLVVTNAPIYYYYHNPDSIMRTSFTPQKVKSYQILIEYIYNYIMKHRPEAIFDVRKKILNKRFKMMVNQAVRKQKDKQKRKELFDVIQPVVQELYDGGFISYDGLKIHHKIELYLLLNTKSSTLPRLFMSLF